MISEIDIRDFTELYKLNRGDEFEFVDNQGFSIPPDSTEINPLEAYKFIGVDGMYAKIRKLSSPTGCIEFVAAWTKVRKL